MKKKLIYSSLILLLILLLIILISKKINITKIKLPQKTSKENLQETPTVTGVFQKVKVDKGGIFSLSPNSGNFKKNRPLEVKIMINSNGKYLTGADSVIKFDPQMVEIIGDPRPGQTFSSYPISMVKKEKGEITITGVIGFNQSPFIGEGVFATIYLKPLKEGDLSLNFDFTPGKTNDSNLAEQGSNLDVLTQVNNANFRIIP